MNFEFHPEAEIEFNKAIDYYAEIEEELGYDFAIEVHSAILRALSYPKALNIIYAHEDSSLDNELQSMQIKSLPKESW